MANYDGARSVNGVALRVSRLAADGSILAGVDSVFTQKAFMSFQFTPEYEEGDEITEKNADGSLCYSSQDRDTLKRVSLELAVCSPDPEITEILSGGTVFSDTEGDIVGYASPLAGEISTPNGVAIEVWSRANGVDGKPMAKNPFYHWVFPFAAMRPSGDRVMENGLMANEFEGWALGNEEFGTGPDGSWKFTSTSPFQYARAATAPVDRVGFSAYTGPVGG